MPLSTGARTMRLEPPVVIICQNHRSESNTVAQISRQQSPLAERGAQHGCRNRAYQEVFAASVTARRLGQLQPMG
jgi:hypothetical protein